MAAWVLVGCPEPPTEKLPLPTLGPPTGPVPAGLHGPGLLDPSALWALPVCLYLPPSAEHPGSRVLDLEQRTSQSPGAQRAQALPRAGPPHCQLKEVSDPAPPASLPWPQLAQFHQQTHFYAVITTVFVTHAAYSFFHGTYHAERPPQAQSLADCRTHPVSQQIRPCPCAACNLPQNCACQPAYFILFILMTTL